MTDTAHRIGTAAVDSLGVWALDLKNTPSALQPINGSIVTIVSTRGGQSTALVQIK